MYKCVQQLYLSAVLVNSVYIVGRRAGSVLTSSILVNNPVCALMVGVLITVFIQSSSASTSIVVTLVAAESKSS